MFNGLTNRALRILLLLAAGHIPVAYSTATEETPELHVVGASSAGDIGWIRNTNPREGPKWGHLVDKINAQSKQPGASPGKRILALLPERSQKSVRDEDFRLWVHAGFGQAPHAERDRILQFLDDFAQLMMRQDLYSSEAFANLPIDPETKELLTRRDKLRLPSILTVQRRSLVFP